MAHKHKRKYKHKSRLFLYLLIGVIVIAAGTIFIKSYLFSKKTSVMSAATINSVEVITPNGQNKILDSKSNLFKDIQSRTNTQLNKQLDTQNQRSGWHDGEVPIPCSQENVLFWTRVAHSFWDNNGYHHGFTITYFYSDGSSCSEIWDSNNFFGINKTLIYSDAGSTSIGRVEGPSN